MKIFKINCGYCGFLRLKTFQGKYKKIRERSEKNVIPFS